MRDTNKRESLMDTPNWPRAPMCKIKPYLGSSNGIGVDVPHFKSKFAVLLI